MTRVHTSATHTQHTHSTHTTHTRCVVKTRRTLFLVQDHGLTIRWASRTMSEAWTLKEMEALGGENGDDHDGGGEKVVEDSLSVIINQLRNLGQSGGDESELYIQSAVPPSPYSTLPRQWSQHLPAPAAQPRCKRILTFAPDIHSQQQQEEEDASCCVKAAELGLSMPCHYCVADTNSSSPEERCGEDGEDGGGGGVTTDVSYDDGWSPAPASAHGSYVAGRRRHHHHNHHNHYNNNHYNHHQQQQLQQNHSHQRRRHGEEEEEAGRHHRWDAGGDGGGGGGGRDDVRHWNHAAPPRSWRLLEPFSTSSLEGDDSFELILREADADEMATVRAVLHKKEKRRRDDGADDGADRGAGKRRRDSGRFFCCCRRGSEPGGGDGTGGRDGGRRCWRSLGSCALALLLAPCLAYAAFAALPWSALAPWRAAAPTTAERLAYALRCGALALLPLVLGMLATGLALLLRQLRGGAAGTSTVRAQRAFVSDTAQQLLLHLLAALVLALNVEPHFLPLVLVTAALFVISRLVFWATIRSCYAGFGFCLSFAPSLAMLCHALYCLFTLGPAGPHGGLDDGGHGGTGARSPPPPHVPPEVQWWGS
ncbi:uncharacterized protein LOC133362783 isoform X1 [Lethenteron reissneri]|uniref:uncharacterized protein LOC133362783 isoform X1 n=2 Tax=Lethenteron reissneri TaxID=7753 RepID=UPI002AB6C805|nr:uncharacterized protein LOC133362783 isoform X1 [Lethenteron reissneri]